MDNSLTIAANARRSSLHQNNSEQGKPKQYHQRHVLTEAYQRAKKLSLAVPLLLGKIQQGCELDEEQSYRGLIEVIRFLDLIDCSGESLTPSLLVDDIWHEFILFTREYHRYCEASYGRYIHHQPEDNLAGNRSRFQRTLLLYSRQYGEPDTRFWGNNGQLDLSGACSSCQALGQVDH